MTANRGAADSQPTPEEKQALGKLIICHLIKANSKKRRPLVEFLFRELAQPGDKSSRLTPAEVCQGLGLAATMANIDRVKSQKNHLKADVDEFFSTGAGQNEQWCVYFEDKDYRPHFRHNDRPQKDRDNLAEFWAPHFESTSPTLLLYPEPMFFKDTKSGIYLRHPSANKAIQRDHFRNLTPEWAQLETTYSFVPSGSVRAMLSLMECFRREWHEEIEAKPFLPHSLVPDTPNLLVVGSSTSIHAVQTLERSLPLHTSAEGITVGDEVYTERRVTEPGGQTYYYKWGSVTRRWHHSPSRVVTVISAQYGGTVDAIARFLTERRSFPMLLQTCPTAGALPSWFQVLFSVEMEDSENGPYSTGTFPYKTVDIQTHLTSQTRSGK